MPAKSNLQSIKERAAKREFSGWRMAIEILDLSSMYDLLYQRASEAMWRFNPCRIRAGLCLRGNFCCQECFHLNRQGCTVASLACRTWLCRKAAKTRGNETCRQVLRIIGETAEELRINGYRCSKEENLRLGEQIIVDAEWMNDCRERLRSCEMLMYGAPAAKPPTPPIARLAAPGRSL